MQIDDLTKRIDSMTPAARAAMQVEIDKALRGKIGLPQPGPQLDAYFSKADVLLFGGNPGGGKSVLCILLALNEHYRSLIVRSAFTDLRPLIDNAKKIVGDDAGFIGGSRPMYKIKGGGVIHFMGLPDDGGVGGMQGEDHDLICVGRGTKVLMGDRSYKEIQDLVVGDIVMTMEGPSPVKNLIPVRRDVGVRVDVRDCHGNIIASQTQSTTHALYSPGGWLCYNEVLAQSSQSSVLRSNLSYVFGKLPEQIFVTSLKLWQFLLGHILGSAQIPELYPQVLDSLYRQATSFSCAQLAQETYCGSSGGELVDAPQPPLLSFQQERSQLPGQSLSRHGYLQPFQRRGISCAGALSLSQGCQGHYSSARYPCGERLPLYLHFCSEQEGVPKYPHQSACAAQPIPTCFEDDAQEQTPIYSHQKEWYTHPYTRERRQILGRVEKFWASYTPVGEVELFDIEVENFNHYITGGGFINKNCIDEAATVTENQARLIMGWLRTDRPGQRTRVVMASNPPLDSTGDWLVTYFAPWLDKTHPNPAKPGELRWFLPTDNGPDIEADEGAFTYIDGITDRDGQPVKIYAESRTFIPSKFTDNQYYSSEEYARRLAGLPDEARRILATGDFMAERTDDMWQLIPTPWVRAAVLRWRNRPVGIPMSALGVDVAQGGCFDGQTEILTDKGWKFFEDITGEEKVLSHNGHSCHWQPITQVHKYYHKGEMNLLERPSVNFCITDNHNLLSRYRANRKWGIKRYDRLPRNFLIKRSGGWVGVDATPVTFKSKCKMPNGGTREKIWTFTPKDWASLLGWFVSEGCAFKENRRGGRWRINISQKEGQKLKNIESLLKKMGIKYYKPKSRSGVEFSVNSIGEHLAHHCGVKAKNKKIPEYIKCATPDIIEAFLETYRMGDGSINGTGNISYATTSHQLANDLHEVLFKIGRAGKLVNKKNKGTSFDIDGRKVIRKNTVYVCSQTQANTDIYINKSAVKRIAYEGYVYCVSTPYRTIAVRRGGCVMWSGNSDNAVIAPRYDWWYDRLKVIPGKDVPEGSDLAGKIVAERRDQCEVTLDMGGGYGGAVKLALTNNGISVNEYKGGRASTARTVLDKLEFWDLKAELLWRLREAFDPNMPGGATIAIPDDPELIAELTAIRYLPPPNHRGKIKIEPKETTYKRFGRSLDRLYAVALSNWKGPRGVTPQHPARTAPPRQGSKPVVKLGYSHRKKRRR